MSFVAIPDSVSEDVSVNALSNLAFRFWAMLLPQVDAWGRISASPEILRGKVWPLTGRSTAETERCLKECAEHGLLRIHVEGALSWIQIQSWDETYRQVGRAPSNRPKSRFPDPTRGLYGAVSPLSGEVYQTPGAVRCGDGAVSEDETKPDPLQAVLSDPSFERLRADPGLPKLVDVWPDFETNRAELKKPLTDTARRALLRNAQEWGASYWASRARESVANSWQGVFIDKNNKPTGPPKPITRASPDEGPIIAVNHVNPFAPRS
jgi:hypothetical protein